MQLRFRSMRIDTHVKTSCTTSRVNGISVGGFEYVYGIHSCYLSILAILDFFYMLSLAKDTIGFTVPYARIY